MPLVMAFKHHRPNDTSTSNDTAITRNMFFENIESQYDPVHVNLTQCFLVFLEGGFGGIGAVYPNGTLVPKGGNYTFATGMSYSACVQHCGSGRESTSWFKFSQEISAWLLPWLALMSQLPFGSKYKLDDVSALALYIGSPALSAYSLIITLLNKRYIAIRFSKISYPNAHHMVQILTGLQQVPLVTNKAGGLLASLVVLPQNDLWFSNLRKSLKCEHGWSAAALTSILWIVVVYALTVSNTFIDDGHKDSSGQAVGSIWLWVSMNHYDSSRSDK